MTPRLLMRPSMISTAFFGFSSRSWSLSALAATGSISKVRDMPPRRSRPSCTLPFERRSAHLFFQLVARRYERGSLLITTNQVVTQWGVVFGDDVLAAAILDRLLHHSHTLMIQGESYRLRQKKKAGLLGRTPPNDG